MAYGPTITDLESGKPIFQVVVPKKLALGGKQKGSKDPGLFRVYVPMANGCELSLSTTAGSIAVTMPDGTAAVDATGAAVAAGASVKFETADGKFGWYGVIVTGSTSYEVSASAKILGQAKDKDGKPLVPWNFYYYPFTDVNGNPNHPSAKYDGRFPGSGANDWEKTNYWQSEIRTKGALGDGFDGHGITRDSVNAYNTYLGKQQVNFDDTWWWGHCDAASCASTIFSKPQANGSLQPIDIKWMLTEMSMRGYDIQFLFQLGGPNGNRQSPSNKEVPDGTAGQELVADIGPLHDALVQCVKKDAHVALMDFRAPFKAGEDHSADVWNQACYKIEIDVKESPNDANADDETAARKIDFYAVLHANADSVDEASANTDPETNQGSGWLRQLTYTLGYNAGGTIDQQGPLNRYTKCEWKEANQTLYSPRYLFKIRGLNMAKGGPGNPKVDVNSVYSLGVQRRLMYGDA